MILKLRLILIISVDLIFIVEIGFYSVKNICLNFSVVAMRLY